MRMSRLGDVVSHAGPVVEVGLLVSMVVHVEVVLPEVVLRVDLVLVDILAHVDLSEDVSHFSVVVEGDGGEWLEVIWVHCSSLAHSIVLALLGTLSLALSIWRVDSEVETERDWVDKEVGSPAHATESAQRVASAHFLFFITN